MEKFKATKVSDNLIELTNNEDLEKLYQIIEKEETFVLVWPEGTLERSEVFFGGNLISKVKSGDLKMTALEGKQKNNVK